LQGNTTTSRGGTGGGDASSIAAAEKVGKLTEGIEAYECQITNVEARLAGLEKSLSEATDNIKMWRSMYHNVVEHTARAAEVQDSVQANEMRDEQESHELWMLESTTSLKEERLWMQSESNATANVLRAEFNKNIKENSRVMLALRVALHKTRREARTTHARGGSVKGKKRGAIV